MTCWNPHPAPETLGRSLNLAHPASLVSQAMPPSQGFPTRKHQPAPAAEKKPLNFMNLCLQLESLPLIFMFIDFLIFAGDLALVLSIAETWICEAKLVELVLVQNSPSLLIKLRLGESMMQRLNMTKSSPLWSL